MSEFRVLNNCPKQWEDLAQTPDCRVRHCATCDLPIHDYQQYSARQWAHIWSENQGRVCGRVVPKVSRRVVVGVVATMVTPPLYAQESSLKMTVKDNAGDTLRSPQADLLGKSNKVLRRQAGNADGVIVWTGLPAGTSTFSVHAAGYQSTRVVTKIREKRAMEIEVRLEKVAPPSIGVLIRPQQ